jgi:hypothetical protein
MAKIYSVEDLFDLDRLTLGNPVNKSGGYFMKIVAGPAGKGGPLYFQSPECYVKQGAIKSGKKMFFDLVFSAETDDVFLSWMEGLEEKTRKELFANREKWFETPLEEHDIESSMMSPYKSWKSGKSYIVRAGVPMTLDKCDLKIYDESEQETDVSNVTDGTRCLVIFEFRGVRASVRSFQFELEIKQMLLVKPTNLFDRCIVRPGSATTKVSGEDAVAKKTAAAKSESLDGVFPQNGGVTNTPETKTAEKEATKRNNDNDGEDGYEREINNGTTTVDESEKEQPPEEIDLGKLTEEVLDLKADETAENIQLKPKNDIYLKLYREARQKAREAKMVALQNYLEAKRIKNTYFLEEMSESDDDIDVDEEIAQIANA